MDKCEVQETVGETTIGRTKVPVINRCVAVADLSHIIRALRGNTIRVSLRDLLVDGLASDCEGYWNGADAMVATSVMKAVFNTAV